MADLHRMFIAGEWVGSESGATSIERLTELKTIVVHLG